MKRLLAVLLAMAMIFSLAACGSETTSVATTESTTTETKTEVADDTVYTLKYATFQSTESSRYTNFEAVFAEKLEKASNGRLVFEMYPNATLCTPPEAVEMTEQGAVDVSTVIAAQFPGTYQYTELFSTPGLYLGDSSEASALAREYSQEFPDAKLNDKIMPLLCYTTDEEAFITTKPVRSIADLKGLTLRCPSCSDYFSELGMTPVSIPANESYESIRLGTVDGAISTVVGLHTFQFYEIADYMIDFPIHKVIENVIINKEKFESLPEDLQQILLDVCEEMATVYDDYQIVDAEEAVKIGEENSEKFEFNHFSNEDIAYASEVGMKYLEELAADMDAQGLKGTEALEWLQAHAKEYSAN